MAHLYLIRHPLTRPDPAVPASQWGLSEAGRQQVAALLDASFWTAVRAIVTSDQQKAALVGAAVAGRYDISHTVVPTLTEAQRDRWLDSDDFLAAQRRFFAHPAQTPVAGWETAQAAGERFRAAVEDVLARHPAAESLALVAHATVLTLYWAHLRGDTPQYDDWRAIGFAEVLAVPRATMQPDGGFCAAPYAGVPVNGV